MKHLDRWLLVLFAIFAAVVVGTPIIRSARSTADYSAHAALTQQICDQLSAISAKQKYPSSLAELPLTFPDGGDVNLLKRFRYEFTDTNCTIYTHLGDRDFTRTFHD